MGMPALKQQSELQHWSENSARYVQTRRSVSASDDPPSSLFKNCKETEEYARFLGKVTLTVIQKDS